MRNVNLRVTFDTVIKIVNMKTRTLLDASICKLSITCTIHSWTKNNWQYCANHSSQSWDFWKFIPNIDIYIFNVHKCSNDVYELTFYIDLMLMYVMTIIGPSWVNDISFIGFILTGCHSFDGRYLHDIA